MNNKLQSVRFYTNTMGHKSRWNVKLYLTQKEKKRLSWADRATGGTHHLYLSTFLAFLTFNRPGNENTQRNTGQLVGGCEF